MSRGVLAALFVGIGTMLAATGGAVQKGGTIQVTVEAVSSCDINAEPLRFDRNLRLRERNEGEERERDDEDEGRERDRNFRGRSSDGGDAHQTGTSNFNWRIRVRCNRHQVYHLAADGGDHLSGGVRHMTNGRGSLVAYRLFKRGRSGEEWGDRDFGNTYQPGSSIIGKGNGRWKTHVLHGRLLRPPRIPPGILRDEVRVSIHN